MHYNKQVCHWLLKDVSPDLDKLRNLPAGKAEGLDGIAGYNVLFSAGKVIDARPPSDAAIYMKGGEAKVRTLAFRGWIPPGSAAKVMRRGALNCRKGECRFMVYPK